MALIQQIEDGKMVESASQSSLKNSATAKDGMDKDAFLQLLVAQMKYQDPLEPTSNTEYISQYAQFSQVEQMQNMSGSMELQRAGALVGQEVYIKTETSDGEAKYVRGKVDYVVYENGKAFLSINEELYSLNDLDTVADKDYITAYDKATKLVGDLKKLPGVGAVSLTDSEKIESLNKAYQEMNDYEKTFVAKDMVSQLEKYLDKLKELRSAEETAEATKETE